MNWRAGASRGFAVVCGPIPIRSELPCKADVARSVVFLSNGLEMVGYGLLGRSFIRKGKRKGVPMKFTAFGFEQTGSRTLKCGECVPHGSAHRVEHDTEHLHRVGVSTRKELVERHQDVARAEVARVQFGLAGDTPLNRVAQLAIPVVLGVLQ